LVQEQKPLADGSAIRLTIARYYTPTGRSIQRPYNRNIEDYYHDQNVRLLHGEMEIADSNKFADSLKFTTPGGKTVYGGGGIMPDIFVPIDTLGVSDYYIEDRNQGLIYRYSLKYADENRAKLSALKTPGEFVKYLDKQGILKRFIAFAASEGVREAPRDIRTSEKIMKVQLYAFIARNFLDNDGFFPIIQDIDNTLLKAVDSLSE
jgi:carboxyl-terminal processing protease